MVDKRKRSKYAGYKHVFRGNENNVQKDLGEKQVKKSLLIQITILNQSWSGFLRKLLQLGITACGIETHTSQFSSGYKYFFRCNRALPLAVLKK